MLQITYKADSTNYKAAPYTNKLTMTDGVDNFDWSYIAELTRDCATLACELRSKLEELQDVMFKQDQCFIADECGDCEGIDSYTIGDYAEQVAEIENNLCLDELA